MPIEIKNLQFFYQKNTPYEREALRDISLTIADGEFVAIVGSTGCGKSTLAQHINGLLRPYDGHITVNGLAVEDKKTKLLSIISQVALSFQYPEHQLFGATVGEEVEAGPRNLGYDLKKIADLTRESLAAVGLSTAWNQSPFALSGGEQRRLALAAVLAMDTPILVLDEPTVGLDPQGRREIGALVCRLHRERKKTVVWIGHNLEEIAALAQRLIVMHRGRIVRDGSISEVLGDYRQLAAYGIRLPAAPAVAASLRERGKPVPFPLCDEAAVLAAIKGWLEGTA